MRNIGTFIIFSFASLTLCSCSYNSASSGSNPVSTEAIDYTARMPSSYPTTEKVVVVNPRAHAWAAYASDGQMVKAGAATAGANFCPDTGHGCRTNVGSFRIYSLGSPDCHSHKFPLPHGGAPMPYCMYFSSAQALHGSPSGEVIDGNISHGCVRMHVADAEWLRFNFANVGTRVIVQPYD